MEVKRGSLIVTFLVLMSAFLATLTTVPQTVEATTLYVGGSGPGNYTTIQEALNAAFPGDVVFVYNGTYQENILINKPLTLIGEDKDTTIVDGRGQREAVNISASNVNITGLTITNSGSGMTPGIEIFSVGSANISGVNVIDSVYGVLLYESDWNSFFDNVFSNERYGARLIRSRYNLFLRSDFHGQWDGLELYNSTDNAIIHNNISFNTQHSVEMMGSDRNNIMDNVFYDNRFGLTLPFSHDNIIVNNIFSLSLHAVTLFASHSNFISNNEMTYHSSSALNMQYGKYNIITDNTISWNNREGIILEDSDHNMVGGNTVLSNNNDGISLWYCHNNSIVGNTVSSNRLSGISSYQSIFDVILNNTVSSSDWSDGIRIMQSNRYIVANNIVSSNDEHGIKVWSSHNNSLWNNQMTSDGIFVLGDALEHWNTHTIDISNTVGGKPVRYLKNTTGGSVLPDAGQVIIANCTDILVENQDVSNGSVGIEIGFSSRITVSNNVASDNVYGIYSHYSSNGTIAGNVAEWSSYGIYLDTNNNDTVISHNEFANDNTGIGLVDYNRNVTISNNLVTSNTRGMYLRDLYYGWVLENTVSLNNDNGIDLIHSDNNTLVGNVFSENGLDGLHMWGADDCSIYHNNFLDNSRQAYDSPRGSQWDNGYPSGGNYWSNYTGVDVFSGPNQDLPGSDAIGDTPFIIDADSIDRYPLLAPYGTFFPRPPLVESAVLSGNDYENVTLRWELSPDDGMGVKSVVGYRIMRNATFHPDGVGYQMIATLPNSTSLFLDPLVGEGDANNYFYQVCAVDIGGNVSCSKSQAAKTTRIVSKGSNLVSVPLIQHDSSLSTVLQTVSFDNAWSYDASTEKWKSFMKSKPYGGTLDYVNHTMGFWVNVTQDSNLTVAGVVPISTTISLQAGWNLVGFPSFDDSYTVADLKVAVAADRIEGFDGSAPPYFLRVLTDGDFLQAGFGYWVRAESETSWTVDNL